MDAAFDEEDDVETLTQEKVQKILDNMIGQTVTKAVFDENGYMVEIGDILRLRSCVAHTILCIKRIQ